jgi:hypothetical protein
MAGLAALLGADPCQRPAQQHHAVQQHPTLYLPITRNNAHLNVIKLSYADSLRSAWNEQYMAIPGFVIPVRALCDEDINWVTLRQLLAE